MVKLTPEQLILEDLRNYFHNKENKLLEETKQVIDLLRRLDSVLEEK